jgi:hypothetical protein
MDFPIQNDADVEQAVLLDLEIQREGVFMPSEEDAGGDGLDVHGGCLEDLSVLGGIFDHFLVELLVLAPASDGVELLETVGKGRHMEIAPDALGGVTILFARLEILADHELKKANRVVGHAWILINTVF